MLHEEVGRGGGLSGRLDAIPSEIDREQKHNDVPAYDFVPPITMQQR
jgi:hypothetical protein